MSESLVPVRLPSSLRSVRYEESGTVTYIGIAAPGSVTNDAVWRIIRITYTGTNFALEHADGNAEFDNVWDDRASLNYS